MSGKNDSKKSSVKKWVVPTKAQLMGLGSCVFGTILLLLYAGIFFFGQNELPPTKHQQVGLISALLAGIFGYFLTGTLKLLVERGPAASPKTVVKTDADTIDGASEEAEPAARWLDLGKIWGQVAGFLAQFPTVQFGVTGGFALFLVTLVWWSSSAAPFKQHEEDKKRLDEMKTDAGRNQKIIELYESQLKITTSQAQNQKTQTELIVSLIPRPSKVIMRISKLSDDAGPYAFSLEAMMARKLDSARKFLDQAENEGKTPKEKIYLARGRTETFECHYPKAIEWLEKAYKEAPEDPDILSDLGTLLVIGNTDRAGGMAMIRHALLIQEKTLGKGDTDAQNKAEIAVARTASTLGRLAGIEHDFQSAEPLLERARDILKSKDPKSGDYSTVLNTLGSVHFARGDIDVAKQFYEQSLAIAKDFYGEEHPEVAMVLANLAAIELREDIVKGTILLEKARGIVGETLGPNHPENVTTINNLAQIYAGIDRHEQAENLFKLAIKSLEDALGPKNPVIADSLAQLAFFYLEHQHASKAEPLLFRARDILLEAYGEKHVQTALGQFNLAAFYRWQGDLGRAKPLYEKARDILDVEGKDPALRGRCLLGLGLLLGQERSFEQARPLLESGVRLLESLGGHEKGVHDAISALAFIDQEEHRYESVEKWIRRKLQLVQKVMHGENPRVEAMEWNDLGWIQLRLLKFDASKVSLSKCDALLSEAEGPKNPMLLVPLQNLMLLNILQDQFSDAIPYAKRVSEIYEAQQGKDGPLSVSARGMLNYLKFAKSGQNDKAEAELSQVVPKYAAICTDQPMHAYILVAHARLLRKLMRDGEAEESKAKSILANHYLKYPMPK